MALTNKQLVFIHEYLKDFNGTQAAIRAGYSEKSARSTSSEILTNPNIQAEIQRQIAERSMGADEVLKRLAEHARGDLGEFMNISGVSFSLDLQGAKDKGITHLIKRVKQKTTTFISKNASDEDREVVETEIELYDAQSALVQLGKHLGLFVDRSESVIAVKSWADFVNENKEGADADAGASAQ